MEVVVWIVIILVAILLIRLLRKWIKRLIFILIILVIAFFIYGCFNPTGASRLWYNVRTLPARVSSRVSNKTFLDYDSYKLNLSSIDKINVNNDGGDDSEFLKDSDNIESSKDAIELADNRDNEKENMIVAEEYTGQQGVSQSFASVTSFTANLSDFVPGSFDADVVLTGYTQKDVLGMISDYLDENLDKDTDIVVTMEYGKGSSPEKIILNTKVKDIEKEYHNAALSLLDLVSVSLESASRKTSIVLEGVEESVIEVQKVEVDEREQEVVEVEEKGAVIPEVKTNSSVSSKSKKGELSQKDVAEAEYIFGTLFE